MLKIISLGSYASLHSNLGKHFSLLLDVDGKKIWIDPSIKYDKKVDAIIITQGDKDHWAYLFNYLKKYPDTNVYSTSGIFKRIGRKSPTFQVIKHNLKLDGLDIKIMAIPPMVGVPAIGLRLDYHDRKISIIPEFDKLGKYEKDLIKKSIWIVGIGEYEKRQSDDHKATFKELISLADELKPERIYLTNFRVNTLRNYKYQIIKELREFHGGILTDNSSIIINRKVGIIKKWHVPYIPKKYKNEQLADDARLFVGVYSNLKKGKKVRISKDSEIYFTESMLFNDFVIPLYKEIASRVSKGKMNYKINLDDSNPIYKEFWDKVKNNLTKEEVALLESESVVKAKVNPGYYSTSKPAYRGYFEELSNNLKSLKWDQHNLLVDAKWDGLRMTLGKSDGDGWAYVDPENLKNKSPDISPRIPAIIKEIEDNFPDNTVLDGEFLAIHPNGKEILHRTVSNSLLNSKVSGEELEQYAVIVIFDVLFYDGLDIRKQPLHERLEYLERLKSTKHIWIEKISTKFPDKADGFIVTGKDVNKIRKIADFLQQAKNGRPKFCAEGIMIKRLDGPYEYPQNHFFLKVKFWHEIDLRVLDKKLVKGSKNTYNYYLGYDTPKDYAKSYLEHTTKDWYGKLYAFKKGKLVASGKEVFKYLDTADLVTFMGKTDNTNIKANRNDILRIAAEEILKFDNPSDPKFPRYSFYIGRALEVIPEKNKTDTIDVIDKLSRFEPKRIPIDELKHIKQNPIEKSSKLTKENILEWVNSGSIPDEIYNDIAKDNEPLPKILYPEYKDGYLAFAQWHIRGLNHDDVEKWKSGKISTKELVKGHSLHMDLRMQFGPKKQLQQWVLLDNDMESYLRGLHGERDPKTGNSAKMLAVVKPSAEEPSKVVKAEKKEMLLDEEGAKIVQEYELKDKSFIIPAGDVGATAYKSAYLMAIWIGTVKFGVQRCYAPGTKFIVNNKKTGEISLDNIRNIVERKRNVLILTDNGWDEIQSYMKIPANNLYTIILDNGAKMTVDENHYTYVYRNGEEIKIPVSQLEIGDLIPYYNKGWEGVSGTYDTGKFIGLWLAEGGEFDLTRNQKVTFHFNREEEELINFVIDFSSKLGAMYTIRKEKGKGVCIELSRAYALNGLIKQFVKENKRLRSCIFGTSIEFRKGVLDGFYLGDGNHQKNVKYKTITQAKHHEGLMKDIFYLTVSFGEVSSIRKTKDRVLLTYNLHNTKQGYWRKFIINGRLYIKIKSIEKNIQSLKNTIDYLYDITMKNNHKIVLAEGIISSNSDLHEVFLYPSPNIPKKNQELLNGKYIIRCFKTGNDKRWWFFKSFDTPKPLDPIEHSWTAYYWPIPASQINKFGREAYRDESKKLYLKKLK